MNPRQPSRREPVAHAKSQALRVIGNLMIGMSETTLPLWLFDAAEPAEKWLLETWQSLPR